MKRLTVVIPSYNRKGYLRQQIAFWCEREVSVIILDGSEVPLTDIDLATPNIKYLHLNKSYSMRISHTSSLICTEYVVILGDDELYIPSALRDCVRFLDQNHDYSSCKGLCVGFRRNYWTSKVEAVNDNSGLRGYSVTKNLPCDRVGEHLSPYETASIYSVHRAEVFHKFAKLLQHDRIYSCAAATELQISLVVAWMGKIHVLDQLMWMRNRENPSHFWNENLLDPGIWLTDQKYAAEIEQFVSDFAKLFEEEDRYEAVKSCLTDVLNTFGKQRMDRLRRTRNSDRFETVYSAFWQRLGEPLKSMIRPMFGTSRSMSSVSKELKSDGVAIDDVEIEEIEAFLKKFSYMRKV